MCFKTFSSQSTSPPECAVKEEISSFPDFTLEPDLSNGSHYPDERFLDVIVHFKLRNITAEFPTVSKCNCRKAFDYTVLMLYRVKMFVLSLHVHVHAMYVYICMYVAHL